MKRTAIRLLTTQIGSLFRSYRFMIGLGLITLAFILLAGQSLVAPQETSSKIPNPEATNSAHASHAPAQQGPSPTVSQPPIHNQPTLLSWYNTPVIGIDWSQVRYQPRQFKTGLQTTDPTRGTQTIQATGNFSGWDFFNGYDASVHRLSKIADYWQLELNREATVGIVWRSSRPIPDWLSSWHKSGPIVVGGTYGGTWSVYTKLYPAGIVSLGGVYDPTDNPQGNADTIDTYWVLLAEANGLPSAAPSVPANLTSPTPNQPCPDWVHDGYQATGPDGKTYATWHPQIDPVYWCYFGHEHGSNPAYFDSAYQPVYGYSVARHGHTEAHAGYKNILWEGQGYRYYLTHHFGTASLKRACIQFHTFDLAIKRLSDNKIVANVHMLGDFGDSRINRSQEILTPPDCPDQGQIAMASGSHGVRQLPAVSADSVGYEPWRVDYGRNVLGFKGGITVNNPDSLVICNNARCDTPVPFGATGSTRFTTDDRFSVQAGANTGTFYTDAEARRLLTESLQTVRQYIEPGLNLTMNIPYHCRDIYGFGRPFVCDKSLKGASPAAREGSIGNAN